jgi:D-glycero-alpha-D-manno-heptose 1-phosphate guanylyltransferase
MGAIREAIVLAGGLGTRLREMVRDVPKPMAPVAGRPFLEYLLARLAAAGVERVVLSVGHQAEVIQRHFGGEFRGLVLAYAHEAVPLGTGGATAAALAHCHHSPVLVLNGDSFLDLPWATLEATWRAFQHPVIVGRVVDDCTRYGRLVSEDGRVVAFTEKDGAGGPGVINAGAYLLPRDFLAAPRGPGPFSLERDVLAVVVERQPVRLVMAPGYFIDIGVPEDYLRAQTELPTAAG